MSGAQTLELESTATSTANGDGWRGERTASRGEGGWPLCLQRFAEIAGS